jgi:maltose alpha-D-glucosyltransferase/alpha-amylase
VSGDAAADRRLLDLMTIQKAAYEVVYELANRPDWLPIPLGGILEILERKVDQS